VKARSGVSREPSTGCGREPRSALRRPGSLQDDARGAAATTELACGSVEAWMPGPSPGMTSSVEIATAHPHWGHPGACRRDPRFNACRSADPGTRGPRAASIH